MSDKENNIKEKFRQALISTSRVISDDYRSNIKNFDKIVLSILICLIFISYLTGFIVTENSAGGAIFDVEFVKRNILAFKNNTFLEAIKFSVIRIQNGPNSNVKFTIVIKQRFFN